MHSVQMLGPTKVHCSTESSFTWAIRWSSRQRATHWPASPSCPCSPQPPQPPTFPGQLLVNRAQASGSPPSLLAPGITSPRHTSSVPRHCWQCSPLCPSCVWCCPTCTTLPSLAWPAAAPWVMFETQPYTSHTQHLRGPHLPACVPLLLACP